MTGAQQIDCGSSIIISDDGDCPLAEGLVAKTGVSQYFSKKEAD
jgi:hypothetical protein